MNSIIDCFMGGLITLILSIGGWYCLNFVTSRITRLILYRNGEVKGNSLFQR